MKLCLTLGQLIFTKPFKRFAVRTFDLTRTTQKEKFRNFSFEKISFYAYVEIPDTRTVLNRHTPSWIILHHQQIKILWSVKGFSVVQEERIDSSGVENSRKRIIKSNHVENHVEKVKLSKEGFNLATSALHGGITGSIRVCER